MGDCRGRGCAHKSVERLAVTRKEARKEGKVKEKLSGRRAINFIKVMMKKCAYN